MAVTTMQETKTRARLCFSGLAIGALLLAIADVVLGSVWIPVDSLVSILSASDSADPLLTRIVMDYRLPRMLTAALAGAALALAGLMMQTVFRNPLADPFVLGVNSGASLGVALTLLLVTPVASTLTAGLGWAGQFAIVAASSIGAACVLVLVLTLSRRVDVMSLLIVGLMLSYAIGAVVSLLMFFSMPERIQAFVNWSFGDYSSVTWTQLSLLAPSVLIGISLAVVLMKPMDALLLGEAYARSIGTPVKQARFTILLAASILAGSITGFCGPVGFIGIAAPHLCRSLFRTSQHRILVPGSLLLGVCLSLAADITSKAPGLEFTLPLNAITALVGAPVIIAALLKQRNLKRVFG